VIGQTIMTTTRTTLLARVKNRSDAAAWDEFHQLYAPLLYRYARSRGLSREDAADVRDACLEVVARKIADFEYDRAKGGFKSWLYVSVERTAPRLSAVGRVVRVARGMTVRAG
jgi:DNA-directed RNA polymerase specialized sigma24 family protein